MYFSSISLISVPIEISAASFTSLSSSSVRISDKSLSLALVLMPYSKYVEDVGDVGDVGNFAKLPPLHPLFRGLLKGW